MGWKSGGEVKCGMGAHTWTCMSLETIALCMVPQFLAGGALVACSRCQRCWDRRTVPGRTNTSVHHPATTPLLPSLTQIRLNPSFWDQHLEGKEQGEISGEYRQQQQGCKNTSTVTAPSRPRHSGVCNGEACALRWDHRGVPKLPVLSNRAERGQPGGAERAGLRWAGASRRRPRAGPGGAAARWGRAWASCPSCWRWWEFPASSSSWWPSRPTSGTSSMPPSWRRRGTARTRWARTRGCGGPAAVSGRGKGAGWGARLRDLLLSPTPWGAPHPSAALGQISLVLIVEGIVFCHCEPTICQLLI